MGSLGRGEGGGRGQRKSRHTKSDGKKGKDRGGAIRLAADACAK